MIKKILLYIFLLANLGVLLWHLTEYSSEKKNENQQIPILLNEQRIRVVKPDQEVTISKENQQVENGQTVTQSDIPSEQEQSLDENSGAQISQNQNDISINNNNADSENSSLDSTTVLNEQHKNELVSEKNEKNEFIPETQNKEGVTGKETVVKNEPVNHLTALQDSEKKDTELNPSANQSNEQKVVNSSEQTDISSLTTHNPEQNTNPLTSSENDIVNKVDSVQVSDASSNQSPLTAMKAESCYSLKPLTLNQSRKFSQFLQDQAIPHKEQHTTKVNIAGYLVMVAPASNYKISKKNLRLVKKAGLDAFLITQGDWKRAVSLGVFSTRANAAKQVRAVKKKLPMLKIQLAPRKREQQIFRVIFKLQNEQKTTIIIERSQINQLKDKYIAEVAKKSCKSIEF